MGWRDNIDVVAAQVLAKGATVRGTVDLRSSKAARLFISIGRGGTTAITNALQVLVRPVLNNDTAVGGGPGCGSIQLASSLTAASATTVNADSAAGQAALNVASATGFAAGDWICIQDAGSPQGVTRLEFQRVSKTATGVLTLDRNLMFAHTAAQADTVRNHADTFVALEVLGGSVWAVVFDYGAEASAESATVVCKAQIWDS